MSEEYSTVRTRELEAAQRGIHEAAVEFGALRQRCEDAAAEKEALRSALASMTAERDRWQSLVIEPRGCGEVRQELAALHAERTALIAELEKLSDAIRNSDVPKPHAAVLHGQATLLAFELVLSRLRRVTK